MAGANTIAPAAPSRTDGIRSTIKHLLASEAFDLRGDNATGWSGHLESTPESVLAFLKDCPFCGGRNLELTNTHTPSYSVECLDCEAEKPCTNPERGKGHPKRMQRALECHLLGIESAIAEWNRRV